MYNDEVNVGSTGNDRLRKTAILHIAPHTVLHLCIIEPCILQENK